MPKPIPETIKEILGQLTGPQQVALRGYIGTLRAEIKDLEAEVLAKSDPDPHAHYHGHEQCTADHSHSAHDHEHHGEEHAQAHDHDMKEEHDHSAHAHEHQEHSHEHGHKHADDDTKDEMPAWKKKALEGGASDAMAAPFGGDWNTESNLSAKDHKMED